MELTIKTLVSEALKESFDLEGVSFAVEQPNDLSHGDYATNVALVVSKQLEARPHVVAEKLIETLRTNKSEFISDVTIAGPGFINFTLSKEFFSTTINTIIDSQKGWGTNTVHSGKNVLVEHSSPNLFKPFHIGHAMNNAIGESLVQLARASGATVTTMSFPSDISLGVAKAVFMMLKHDDKDNFTIEQLGDAYVQGTALYKEDESIHARVKEIADNLYARVPSSELELYEKCKAFNIAYFESIVVTRLGSHFDAYIYESEAGVLGKEIVVSNTPKVFTESEGAIVYIPEEGRKDINTSVFINSQGNPTYEAKDIGLLSMKFDRFNPDISLFMTDNEQVPHFKVVLDAAKKINVTWADNSVHVHHGRMSFKGQKMSSRLGGVPLAETLIETVGEEVRERARDINNSSMDAIAIGAIKFSILRAAAGKDINFDPETSLSFEGDSGPYLQYSTVRAVSILAKAGTVVLDTTAPEGWTTTTLEKLLIHYPEVVAHAIQDWSPHHLVTYLLELAQSFNSWYGNTKIIDETPESPYKLALTHAFAQTMQNGLRLLGIKVPEKM